MFNYHIVCWTLSSLVPSRITGGDNLPLPQLVANPLWDLTQLPFHESASRWAGGACRKLIRPGTETMPRCAKQMPFSTVKDLKCIKQNKYILYYPQTYQ